MHGCQVIGVLFGLLGIIRPVFAEKEIPTFSRQAVTADSLTEDKTALQQPEIVETVTNDFAPAMPSSKESKRLGVQSLSKGEYRDSLVRNIDSIEEYIPQEGDTLTYRYYRVHFGNNTLCYRERRPVIVWRHHEEKIIEVESKVSPHQRFKARINGLDEAAIDSLLKTMQQMKTSDRLMNNEQTCLFYALQLLLDAKGIDPAPVITRNTTFTDGKQLPAFFNHILSLRGSHPCNYQTLKKIVFPEDCVLVFRNAYGQFIHAAFYRKETDTFYTKNGLHCPVMMNNLRPLCERYGRFDTKQKELNEEGLKQKADTLLVYCLSDKHLY